MRKMIVLCLLWLGTSCCPEGSENYQNQTDHTKSDVAKIKKILSNPNDKRILINAHRGDWRNTPENSLQAIESCISKGIDIVEIDIRESKDGVLVLMHDKTLDRTTNATGKISDWTYDSLRSVRLINGVGWSTEHEIPTLDQALGIAKGLILVQPDVKCRNCFDKVKEAIINIGMEGQVVFGLKGTVAESKEFFGELYGRAILVPSISSKSQDIPGQALRFAQSNLLACVFKFEQDTANYLSHISSLRKTTRIWVQTIQPHRCGGHDDDLAFVDPDAAYGWLLDKGASIFLTDRPMLLLDYLKSKGLHD